jgi:hypothetical protein
MLHGLRDRGLTGGGGQRHEHESQQADALVVVVG